MKSIHTVQCGRCHAQSEMPVWESVNTSRDPHARQWVLERTLNLGVCPICEAPLVAVMPVLYVDLELGLWIYCLPPWMAKDFAQAEKETQTQFSRLSASGHGPPIAAEVGDAVELRLTYGYEQLREKVLCGLDGLDDRVVEILKLQLFLQIPALLQDGVFALTVDEVTPDTLVFSLGFEDDRGEGERELMTIPRTVYDTLAAVPNLRVSHPALYTGAYCNSVRYRVGG